MQLTGSEATAPTTIAEALLAAGMRPIGESLDERAQKQQRATNLSNALAVVFSHALRERGLKGTLPGPDGAGLESRALTIRGGKRLDVNYSTLELGLGLGISIKTMMSRDSKTGNYVHNLKRNDEELQTEANSYHKRQPYAVLVAVVFFPVAAAFDRGKRGIGTTSSLAKAVKHFRFLASRPTPRDDPEYFEKFYIGLLGTKGEGEANEPPPEQLAQLEGHPAVFVDATDPPLRIGVAPKWKTFDTMIDEIVEFFHKRNSPAFEWAHDDNDQEDAATLPDDEDE